MLYVPIFPVKTVSIVPKLSKFPYTGRGNSHKNHWLKPFSAFPGNSIKDLATASWLNPPTVRLVVFMETFASPVTES